MEEEIAQLKDLVAQLQAENQRMRQEWQASLPGPSTSGSAASGPPTVSNVVTERLVYLPRERKCPMFRGRTGISIVEWVEEVQACTRARHMSPAEQAIFLFDHLEGEAREEIKYRSQQEREDPNQILAILQELYGCSRSYVSLQEEFFSRKQQDGETLQEFSHALLCLMDKVVKKTPGVFPNKDVLLRDQFVEHVVDCSLRRELKQFVRSHPHATLIDVRSEAIRWEQEGLPNSGRGRSHSVPNVFGFQQTMQPGYPNYSQASSSYNSELGELKEILKNQQEQLNRLTQSLATLNNVQHTQPNNRKRNVICRRCQKSGHFARECEEQLAAPQPPATSVQFHSNSRQSSQNQGNFHPLSR